jgi:hypothetical protein
VFASELHFESPKMKLVVLTRECGSEVSVVLFVLVSILQVGFARVLFGL